MGAYFEIQGSCCLGDGGTVALRIGVGDEEMAGAGGFGGQVLEVGHAADGHAQGRG